MAAEGTIDTKAKALAPPDAVSCCMVDHANARTLFQLFDTVCANKDDAMVEKIVHTIGTHCRMHNQAVVEALIPLVAKLKKGGAMQKHMKEKLLELEQLLEKVDASKKHLDNEEFVQAMEKQRKADNEMMEMMEGEVLPALLEEMEGPDLAAAAEQIEAIKMKAPLAPQVQAFA